jgi:hypothetical protein
MSARPLERFNHCTGHLRAAHRAATFAVREREPRHSAYGDVYAPHYHCRPALALALAPVARADAQLMQADFTGGTLTLWGALFNQCCNTPFAGLTYRGPNVSGSFIFNQSLIPPSGLVNVALPSTPDDPFRIVMGDVPGAQIFTAAMALPTTSAQAQYQNGAFVGFAYFTAFFYNQHEYQLDIQGGIWTIYDRAGGVENVSNKAASGYIDRSLTNVRPYTPVTATPEPASIALVATGLAGVFGATRLRRHRQAVE